MVSIFAKHCVALNSQLSIFLIPMPVSVIAMNSWLCSCRRSCTYGTLVATVWSWSPWAFLIVKDFSVSSLVAPWWSGCTLGTCWWWRLVETLAGSSLVCFLAEGTPLASLVACLEAWLLLGSGWSLTVVPWMSLIVVVSVTCSLPASYLWPSSAPVSGGGLPLKKSLEVFGQLLVLCKWYRHLCCFPEAFCPCWREVGRGHMNGEHPSVRPSIIWKSNHSIKCKWYQLGHFYPLTVWAVGYCPALPQLSVLLSVHPSHPCYHSTAHNI